MYAALHLPLVGNLAQTLLPPSTRSLAQQARRARERRQETTLAAAPPRVGTESFSTDRAVRTCSSRNAGQQARRANERAAKARNSVTDLPGNISVDFANGPPAAGWALVDVPLDSKQESPFDLSSNSSTVHVPQYIPEVDAFNGLMIALEYTGSVENGFPAL